MRGSHRHANTAEVHFSVLKRGRQAHLKRYLGEFDSATTSATSNGVVVPPENVW